MNIEIGSTGIVVEKNGFGALPIQRRDMKEASKILRRAFEGGIRFFDTARDYTDSEAKIGQALHDVREQICIATKTSAKDVKTFWKHLDISLNNLRTDYIDIYQFHNPPVCFRPDDKTGLYEAALEAKAQGKIRHIGISNHQITVARDAVESGLYVSLQFPFSYLATEEEADLMRRCTEKGMAFISMKAMSGGLLKNFYTANAYLARLPVIPIWGIQWESELDELLECVKNTPDLTEERLQIIEDDRKEFGGEFCRGCGYCLPCPAKIDIPQAARMILMLRRSSVKVFTSQQYREMMNNIPNCTGCKHCLRRCPYHLDVPRLLRDNYEDYVQFTSKRSDG